MGWITVAIVVPLVAAVVLAFASELDDSGVRAIGLIGSVGALLASLVLAVQFDITDPNLQLAETFTWIPAVGAATTNTSSSRSPTRNASEAYASSSRTSSGFSARSARSGTTSRNSCPCASWVCSSYSPRYATASPATPGAAASVG